MTEKYQEYNLKCIRVEDGSKKGYGKFTFEYPLGRVSIEEEERYWGLIDEGKVYGGLFKISEKRNFIGQENKLSVARVIGYSLEKLILEGDIIWTKKE